MTVEDNLAKLAEALQGVNHSATINSKYKYGRLMTLIGQLTGFPSETIYASQVSKPDNLDVRFGQSKDARRAAISVAVILDGKFSNAVIAAAQRFSEEYGRTLVLLVQKHDGENESWRPRLGLASTGDGKSLKVLQELREQLGDFEIRETQAQLFNVVGFSPDAIGRALEGDASLPVVLSAVTETHRGLSEVESAVVRRRREAVEQLQVLAATPGTTETDLQRAIGDKYWLFGGRYVGIAPRRKFTFLDEYDIPLLCADGSLHIVELKGPCIPGLVKEHRRHYIVGKDVHEAVAQTVNYLRALDDQRASLQVELSEELDFEVDLRRVRSSVVIGHPTHVQLIHGAPSRLQIDQAIRSYNSHLSRIEVLTYKDLLDAAERTLVFEEELTEG
ncbi:Shedu anti-phage system protein SduA domain-containing protein [Streptomyces sp. NPDC020996]|uniref:Shedu anti-phage system protein SduA domain-containing protein n=1 Tax=Streptomyces sp. NPDC020996 TaxID=3154791 RepID=UPI0033D8E1BD